jgi:hypothetical protein
MEIFVGFIQPVFQPFLIGISGFLISLQEKIFLMYNGDGK